jgi:hypothetical protein
MDLDGGYVFTITEAAAAKLNVKYLLPDQVVGEFELIQRTCALASHPSLGGGSAGAFFEHNLQRALWQARVTICPYKSYSGARPCM